MTRTYLDLTTREVSETVSYDPLTGEFRWLRTHSRYVAGEVAGRKAAKGYRGLTLNKVPVLCHRLAWFIMTGAWPPQDVDHENGNRSDNRFSNLRPGSRGFNMQNLRRAHVDSESQLLGAYFDKRRGTWYSKIAKEGRTLHMGPFGNAVEANAAYLRVKRQIHEACTI